ncbi:hypothetical protein [Ruegeria halocynthiae]|uniref:hypothetical protein n=1 Tax=Ruegeria halocynthiae TaxID=985054 RepID=UPI00056ABD36|nr:hypothetical protein [Ruegeria halocynthiae]
MKPAFALSFSTTGISLHHHSDDDWFRVGEVDLAASDLSDQLRDLRDKGFALENDLSCKVMIPLDQVRFLSVTADGPPTDEADQNVRVALADSTPYSVQDLVFATSTAGSTTYAAAVTRQTLDEARDFAIEHGFIPVQFSTEPDPQDFPTDVLFSAPPQDRPAADTLPPASDTTVSEDATNATPDAPTVHPVADETAPPEFRSAPVMGSNVTPKATPEPLTKRYAVPAAAAAAVFGAALGLWALTGSDSSETSDTELAQIESPPSTSEASANGTPAEPETTSSQSAEVAPGATESDPIVPDPTSETPPDVSATDAAILEALKVAPTQVDEVARDAQTQLTLTQTGQIITTPEPLISPPLSQPVELYLASVDNSNLSRDAIALPPVQSLETDEPFDQVALPSIAGTRFDLDERGLVIPTPEGALNPDGIIVFLGRPSKVPPEVPVRFEQEPIQEDTNNRLAEKRPKLRPGDLIERFERQQLGGRTRGELAVLRPKLRPKSLQEQPQVDETPTALAVVRVPRPRIRPAGLVRTSGTKTANLGSTAAIAPQGAEAGTFKPKAVAPKIPSSASVARRATIDNALNLRKLNLIGVYGTPANRRALVRLPSGRYKKLKIGDRIDGGKVIAISDSELRYQKKGRNLTLKMPRS